MKMANNNNEKIKTILGKLWFTFQLKLNLEWVNWFYNTHFIEWIFSLWDWLRPDWNSNYSINHMKETEWNIPFLILFYVDTVRAENCRHCLSYLPPNKTLIIKMKTQTVINQRLKTFICIGILLFLLYSLFIIDCEYVNGEVVVEIKFFYFSFSETSD